MSLDLPDEVKNSVKDEGLIQFSSVVDATTSHVVTEVAPVNTLSAAPGVAVTTKDKDAEFTLDPTLMELELTPALLEVAISMIKDMGSSLKSMSFGMSQRMDDNSDSLDSKLSSLETNLSSEGSNLTEINKHAIQPTQDNDLQITTDDANNRVNSLFETDGVEG